MISDVANVLIGLSAIGCLYALFAAFITCRYGRRRSAAPKEPCAVSVLKPLHGDEPRLRERLEALCRQNYSAPIQIVLGVQSPSDPALSAAIALAAAYPDRVAISIDSRIIGANRKVSNLINMSKLAQHDVLVIADSDIEVGPNYVCRLVGSLQEPGTGAVTCLYHGVPESGAWSRMCGMAIDLCFLPNAIVGLVTGLAKPCFGSTIAIRRETLAAIGGFETYANHLADDYAIGMAVRDLGLRVAVPGLSVGHICDETNAMSLWLQELRWARTVRTVDLSGYAGTIVTHPFPLALTGLALGNLHGAWLAMAALVSRYTLCVCVERGFNLPRHAYWMIPLRDLLSFTIFVWSFAGSSVHWRGREHEVTRDGLLQPREMTR